MALLGALRNSRMLPSYEPGSASRLGQVERFAAVCGRLPEDGASQQRQVVHALGQRGQPYREDIDAVVEIRLKGPSSTICSRFRWVAHTRRKSACLTWLLLTGRCAEFRSGAAALPAGHRGYLGPRRGTACRRGPPRQSPGVMVAPVKAPSHGRTARFRTGFRSGRRTPGSPAPWLNADWPGAGPGRQFPPVDSPNSNTAALVGAHRQDTRPSIWLKKALVPGLVPDPARRWGPV